MKLRCNNQRKIICAKWIYWVAIPVYLAVIFTFSSHDGDISQSISKGIVQEVNKHIPLPAVIYKNNRAYKINYNFILRKAAHFLEYFILALLIYRALSLCGFTMKSGSLLTLALCILYAASDELHQRFVSGRSGLMKDVLIDTIGSALAITGVCCFCFIRKNIIIIKMRDD